MRRVSFFGSSPLFASFTREMLTAVGGMASVFVSLALFGLLARVTNAEWLVGLGPLPLIITVMLGWIPSRIHVGDDGVLWQWLRWKRFVRFSEIKEAIPFHNGVELELHSGEKVRLASSVYRLLMMGFQTEKRDAILAAIRRGLEAAHTHHVTEAASLVAKAGRSGSEWLAALRSLFSSDGGYRAPSLTRDVLWRIAEDASADETARVGAAFALRKGISAEDRVRLKEIANAAASPKIRVALDAASEESDEPLESALHEL